MSIPRPSIQEWKQRAVQVPWWVGKNAFFGFLILFFIALLISSVVFYRYVFSAQEARLETEPTQGTFREQTLQRVMQVWQERAVRLEQIGRQQPGNIFVPVQQAQEDEEREEGE